MVPHLGRPFRPSNESQRKLTHQHLDHNLLAHVPVSPSLGREGQPPRESSSKNAIGHTSQRTSDGHLFFGTLRTRYATAPPEEGGGTALSAVEVADMRLVMEGNETGREATPWKVGLATSHELRTMLYHDAHGSPREVDLDSLEQTEAIHFYNRSLERARMRLPRFTPRPVRRRTLQFARVTLSVKLRRIGKVIILAIAGACRMNFVIVR